ncbi:MAG: poly-beta-1,6-N-acetyl-D-glucosamine biosynthesis protein PgaD [Spongiibacteraceae bacterium]
MNARNKSLIINRPDLVPPGQKLTAWGITLFFWAALLYLWQPLLSLLAWGLNIQLFYNHMILLGGYRTFLDLLVKYLITISILGGGLIVWARINQWRFRGKERRTGIGATDMKSLATSFGLGLEEIEAFAGSKVVSVTFVDEQKISVVIDR